MRHIFLFREMMESQAVDLDSADVLYFETYNKDRIIQLMDFKIVQRCVRRVRVVVNPGLVSMGGD